MRLISTRSLQTLIGGRYRFPSVARLQLAGAPVRTITARTMTLDQEKHNVTAKTLPPEDKQSLIHQQSSSDTSGTSVSSLIDTKKLGTRDRIKLAVRDYGGTVIVFHVTISLMSLGSCYLLVSSGLDIVGLLGQIGLSEEFLQSKITQGGSTFVLAYAIHKVFAPVRLAATLTCVSFIVKKLRDAGILKKPVV